MESSTEPSWNLRIDRKVQRQVRDCFPDYEQRAAVWSQIRALAFDPFPPKAKQQWWNWRAWRIHVGDAYRKKHDKGWRAVYTVNQHTRTVIVIRVAHRKTAYNAKPKRYRFRNPAELR